MNSPNMSPFAIKLFLFLLLAVSLLPVKAVNLSTFVNPALNTIDPDDNFIIRLGLTNPGAAAAQAPSVYYGHYFLPDELEFVSPNSCICAKTSNINQVSCLLYLLEQNNINPVNNANNLIPVFKLKNPASFCAGGGTKTINLGQLSIKPQTSFVASSVVLNVNCDLADGNPSDDNITPNNDGNGGSNPNPDPDPNEPDPPSTSAYFRIANSSITSEDDGDFTGTIEYEVAVTNTKASSVLIDDLTYNMQGSDTGTNLAFKVDYIPAESDSECLANNNTSTGSVTCEFGTLAAGETKKKRFKFNIRDASITGNNPGFTPTLPCADKIVTGNTFNNSGTTNTNLVAEITGFSQNSTSNRVLKMDLNTSGLFNVNCDSQIFTAASDRYDGNNASVPARPSADAFFRIEAANITRQADGDYIGHLDYDLTIRNPHDVPVSISEIEYNTFAGDIGSHIAFKTTYNEALSNPSCRNSGSDIFKCDFQNISPNSEVSRKFRLNIKDASLANTNPGFVPPLLCADAARTLQSFNNSGTTNTLLVDEITGFERANALSARVQLIDLDISAVSGLDCDKQTFNNDYSTTATLANNIDAEFKIASSSIAQQPDGDFVGHIIYELSLHNPKDTNVFISELGYNLFSGADDSERLANKITFNKALSDPSCRISSNQIFCDYQSITPNSTVTRRFRVDIRDRSEVGLTNGFQPSMLCDDEVRTGNSFNNSGTTNTNLAAEFNGLDPLGTNRVLKVDLNPSGITCP